MRLKTPGVGIFPTPGVVHYPKIPFDNVKMMAYFHHETQSWMS